MQEPGEQRPSSGGSRPIDESAAASERGWSGRHAGGRAGGRAGAERGLGASLVLATLVVILVGAAWAVLRGVLELGVTALAAAALGGWAIGVLLRGRAPLVLPALMGAAAWSVGLLLSWLLAMAFLPGSTRTLPERLAATPFIDWLAPQFGLLDLAGAVLCAGAAVYSARPPAPT